MLLSLYRPNPHHSSPSACELAIAILLGCRVEPGDIKLEIETDEEGYQVLVLKEI